MDKLNYSVAKKEFDFKEGTKKISLERLLYIESKLHKLEFHVMEDDMMIYTTYALITLAEHIIAVGTMLIIGILFNQFILTIIFLVFFLSLRKRTGIITPINSGSAILRQS